MMCHRDLLAVLALLLPLIALVVGNINAEWKPIPSTTDPGVVANAQFALIVKAKDDRFGTSNNYNTVVRDYLDGRRDLIGFW
ncbi:hypothetical protein M0R45_028214 [Rubus argutus]|uniref:Uncharacterized protein n=1 Tax=Rubus argutus TaxID=59490 RepID=A0AAW1W508_RUBAR